MATQSTRMTSLFINKSEHVSKARERFGSRGSSVRVDAFGSTEAETTIWLASLRADEKSRAEALSKRGNKVLK